MKFLNAVKEVFYTILYFITDTILRIGFSIIFYLLLIIIGVLFLCFKDYIFSLIHNIIFVIKMRIRTAKKVRAKMNNNIRQIPRISKRKLCSMIYYYTCNVSRDYARRYNFTDESSYVTIWFSHFVLLPELCWDYRISDKVLNKFLVDYPKGGDNKDHRHKWITSFAQSFSDQYSSFCAKHYCNSETIHNSFRHRHFWTEYILDSITDGHWTEGFQIALNRSISIYYDSVSQLLCYAYNDLSFRKIDTNNILKKSKIPKKKSCLFDSILDLLFPE